MTQNKTKIAIIGGSGLDDPKLITQPKNNQVKTQFSRTPVQLKTGQIKGKPVVFLARHGKGHTVSPTQVNYQANIQALKQVGCTHILATTACGSLRAKMRPGDLVFLDQFIDFTKLRKLTFFEKKVVHTAMSEPFDQSLRKLLVKSAKSLKLKYHPAGTMITIEGPRFSTKAESAMFRKWGADLINMSTVPEVVLANELGIPYQSIAMVTDYDCWKEEEEPVTAQMVNQRMAENSHKVIQLLIKTIANFK